LLDKLGKTGKIGPKLMKTRCRKHSRLLLSDFAGRGIAIVGSLLMVAKAEAQPAVALWTNHFAESGGDDNATAIAVDSTGNAFVTGFAGYGGYTHWFTTIKYSNSGAALWTNYYYGPILHGDDRATSLVIDGEGSVIVAGYSLSGANSYDYATVKYSNDGQSVWTNRYDGPGKGEDHATAIAVDRSNNVFVTGFSPRSSSFPYNNDFATLKYSSSGVPLWTNRYIGPANADDRATGIALDTNGDVYVTGYSDVGGGTYGYATLKYSSAGAPLWTNCFGIGRGAAIATGTNGNVYVTGFVSVGTSLDYGTIAYSSGGTPIWTNYYNGTGNYLDYGSAIAVAPDGGIIVSGYSSSSSSNYDIVTIKYATTGISLWTNTFDEGFNDFANAIAVGANGDVFVTGYSYNTNGSLDQVTLAYSAAGVPLWTNVYSGPGDGNDVGNAIAADNHGNVFVTGYSDPGDFSHEYTTIKYSPIVLLSIQPAGNKVVLTWTNANYGLQCAPSTSGVFTNIPGATSPYTNSPTSSQQFFRLINN
jgi:uncharacterized delta-60 repeat protein